MTFRELNLSNWLPQCIQWVGNQLSPPSIHNSVKLPDLTHRFHRCSVASHIRVSEHIVYDTINECERISRHSCQWVVLASNAAVRKPRGRILSNEGKEQAKPPSYPNIGMCRWPHHMIAHARPISFRLSLHSCIFSKLLLELVHALPHLQCGDIGSVPHSLHYPWKLRLKPLLHSHAILLILSSLFHNLGLLHILV